MLFCDLHHLLDAGHTLIQLGVRMEVACLGFFCLPWLALVLVY